MDLKSIMPTEIRQRKDKYRMSSLMCEIFRKMATVAMMTTAITQKENLGSCREQVQYRTHSPLEPVGALVAALLD